MSNQPGILYIVATPIGNLGDFSPRAVDVLKHVDFIAAEDTRHSKKLLAHFGINRPLVSCHEHNETEQARNFCDRLQQGESIALVSDAGTPLVSDPGYRIVREAIQRGLRISPVPGPCAAIAALSVSGLSSDRFLFVGFLPPKQGARLAALTRVADETATLIFYESPRRMRDTLENMVTVFGGERQAVLARELTKLHETVGNGTLLQLLQAVDADSNWQKGELVILLEGNPVDKRDRPGYEIESVLRPLLAELSLKQAVHLASQITGARKNDVYQIAVDLSRD